MLKVFKLSSKNQATVPTWVRHKLQVRAHQGIEYQPLGKHTVIMKAAKKPDYSHIFDQPGLTRKNFDKFMRDVDMPNNNSLVGKEKF